MPAEHYVKRSHTLQADDVMRKYDKKKLTWRGNIMRRSMTCMALFKAVSYLINNIPKNENINIMKTRVASDTAIKEK
jgi:hypothetical protein